MVLNVPCWWAISTHWLRLATVYRANCYITPKTCHIYLVGGPCAQYGCALQNSAVETVASRPSLRGLKYTLLVSCKDTFSAPCKTLLWKLLCYPTGVSHIPCWWAASTHAARQPLQVWPGPLVAWAVERCPLREGLPLPCWGLVLIILIITITHGLGPRTVESFAPADS